MYPQGSGLAAVRGGCMLWSHPAGQCWPLAPWFGSCPETELEPCLPPRGWQGGWPALPAVFRTWEGQGCAGASRGTLLGALGYWKDWGKSCRFVQLLLLLKDHGGKVLSTSSFSHHSPLFESCFFSPVPFGVTCTISEIPNCSLTSYVLPSRDF